MGAMARHGPHQVAQKSTSTGLSDFKTSWSKFASVTSTIPLPAIYLSSVVTSHCSADAPGRAVVAGTRTILMNTIYKCCPKLGPTLYRTTCHSMRGGVLRSQKPFTRGWHGGPCGDAPMGSRPRGG